MAARWCGSTASHQRRLRQRNQRLRRGSPSPSNSSAHTNRTRGGRRWPDHGDGMRRRKNGEARVQHNSSPCDSSEQMLVRCDGRSTVKLLWWRLSDEARVGPAMATAACSRYAVLQRTLWGAKGGTGNANVSTVES